MALAAQVLAVAWVALSTAFRPLVLTVEVLLRTWQYRRRHNPTRSAFQRLAQAASYREWAVAAEQLDRLEGNETWKAQPASPDYDYRLLQSHIEQLAAVRQAEDLPQLMFLVRTLLSRNVGHMGKPKLYTYTRIGTKRLIEEYIEEVVHALQCIMDAEALSLDTKYTFFSHFRQAYGRTALLLSGGAAFGLFHSGILKCLYECQLLPRIVSGSSSGSIMAAMLCTRTDNEVYNLLEVDAMNLEVFEHSDNAGLLPRLTRLLKHGNLYETQVLIKSLRENIGEMTFLEAYNRTRRILNITVSTSTVHEMQRLLNYLTAPNVVIWSAVAASCAAPFLFASVPILAKDKQGKYRPWDPNESEWIDGSVQNDLPMQRLAELFNVNHFIVSQVNPYVIPFMRLSDTTALLATPLRRLVRGLTRLASHEVLYRVRQLQELAILPHFMFRLQAILAQRYSGDITILPHVTFGDYLRVITNPSPSDLRCYTVAGERAIWPKVSIIKNHCQVELFLDQIIYTLRSERIAILSREPIRQQQQRRRHRQPRKALPTSFPLSPLVTTQNVQVALTAPNSRDADGSGDRSGIPPFGRPARDPSPVGRHTIQTAPSTPAPGQVRWTSDTPDYFSPHSPTHPGPSDTHQTRFLPGHPHRHSSSTSTPLDAVGIHDRKPDDDPAALEKDHCPELSATSPTGPDPNTRPAAPIYSMGYGYGIGCTESYSAFNSKPPSFYKSVKNSRSTPSFR
ncbi:Lipase 5 [Dimargaris cristalligena]|nr:Lipase 5 [Dimargaris cristalligena]